jgi:hypothetical protein
VSLFLFTYLRNYLYGQLDSDGFVFCAQVFVHRQRRHGSRRASKLRGQARAGA